MADAAPNEEEIMIALLVLVAALCTPLVVGWLNADSSPSRPSLCDLLRTGWTISEVTVSDQWRDWPASMSRTERAMQVVREAGRDCPHLVGL